MTTLPDKTTSLTAEDIIKMFEKLEKVYQKRIPLDQWIGSSERIPTSCGGKTP